MRRAGCAAALAALAALAVALAAYREQDYRARFARAAGELVAVRDSTSVGLTPDGFQLTDVTLVSDTGMEVRARLRAPGLRDGVRRPAMILLAGYQQGRLVAEAPPATDGVIMASIDYPYEPRPRGIDWLWEVPRVRQAMMETPPALLLLAQYLYVRDDVDPEHVTIMGVSLGVPFAAIAAATDRRLAGAVLIHGGGDAQQLLATVMKGEVPEWTRIPLSHLGALLVAPVEPTKYAGAIAPRPLLMINATDDEEIPRASVLALYDAARRPKRLVWVQSRHVGLSQEELIARLMDETLAWMAASGLR